jgi:hypothetical protein
MCADVSECSDICIVPYGGGSRNVSILQYNFTSIHGAARLHCENLKSQKVQCVFGMIVLMLYYVQYFKVQGVRLYSFALCNAAHALNWLV